MCRLILTHLIQFIWVQISIFFIILDHCATGRIQSSQLCDVARKTIVPVADVCCQLHFSTQKYPARQRIFPNFSQKPQGYNLSGIREITRGRRGQNKYIIAKKTPFKVHSMLRYGFKKSLLPTAFFHLQISCLETNFS